MRVLILGSGAREHALAWKLAQSRELKALFVGPGNPGVEPVGQCVPLNPSDPRAVEGAVRQLKIDLLLVGPEGPLVAGVADAVRALGVPVFGPSAGAAHIEGSKAFAKEIMRAAGVPTAGASVFSDLQQAQRVARQGGPVVVKADGLAAGKGVVVADSGEEAAEAVSALGALPAGQVILLEERLSGPELSVIALCDGERAVLLPTAQDHKRLCEGDQGPNTGGMGAYSPAPLLDASGLEAVRTEVILPTLRELARRGLPFRGALYAGLMLTSGGPRVLEFNARLGDPETQVLMMQVESDLLPWFLGAASGRLPEGRLVQRGGCSVGIVLAAPGYPSAPKLGSPIDGLDSARSTDVQVFHAGTKRDASGRLVTAGGRVLTVCAHGASAAEARARALGHVNALRFEGCQFRRDIAAAVRDP